VLRQAYERDTTDPEVVQVFEAALQRMRAAGAVIVDPAAVDLTGVRRRQGAGPCGGFKYDMNRYLAGLGARAPQRDLAAIVRSRQFHPTVQRRLETALEGAEHGPESDECRAEQGYRAAFRAAVDAAMDRLRLDAFVYPTWSNPPRLIGDLNTPHGDNSQVFAPVTGYPAINVPMGYTRGNTLPAGITFFGRGWDEPTLIRLAYGYEQLTRHRRKPPI
jgi:amidase